MVQTNRKINLPLFFVTAFIKIFFLAFLIFLIFLVPYFEWKTASETFSLFNISMLFVLALTISLLLTYRELLRSAKQTDSGKHNMRGSDSGADIK